MKPTFLFRTLFWLSLLAAADVLISSDARADFDAVTNKTFEGVGYVSGGIAFSFTPITNLAISRVGYFNSAASSPIITIWSATNFPIASYQLIPGASSGMVYSNVSLSLLAGQRYSISVQDGSPPQALLFQFYTNGQFQIAPQLTNVVSSFILPGSGFTSFQTDNFILGPNFSYQVQVGAVAQPELSITESNGNSAVLSWAASPGGFVLQQKTDLIDTNWIYNTNTISVVNNSNRVTISPATGNLFFRLIHP